MKFLFLFEVDLKVAAYAAPLKVPPDAVASCIIAPHGPECMLRSFRVLQRAF